MILLQMIFLVSGPILWAICNSVSLLYYFPSNFDHCFLTSIPFSAISRFSFTIYFQNLPFFSYSFLCNIITHLRANFQPLPWLFFEMYEIFFYMCLRRFSGQNIFVHLSMYLQSQSELLRTILLVDVEEHTSVKA